MDCALKLMDLTNEILGLTDKELGLWWKWFWNNFWKYLAFLIVKTKTYPTPNTIRLVANRR